MISGENQIHPTAILEGDIRMGHGNVIGPHVVMRGDIEMGDHNSFGTGVCLEHRVRIGNDNRLFPYACVGAVGEMGAKGDRLTEAGAVVIGHHVTLREFVCVHAPVYSDQTYIGDNVYLMNKCYVAHDVVIERSAVLSAGVALAGRSRVGAFTHIGMGAVVHQHRVIGTGVMIGMGSVVTRDILPYSKVSGNPVRLMGFNSRSSSLQHLDPELLAEMPVFFESPIVEEADTVHPLIKEILAFLKLYPDSLMK